MQYTCVFGVLGWIRWASAHRNRLVPTSAIASASASAFRRWACKIARWRHRWPYGKLAFGFLVDSEYLCYGTSWAFGLFGIRGSLYWDEKPVAYLIAPSVESDGCKSCAWSSKKSDVIRSFVWLPVRFGIVFRESSTVASRLWFGAFVNQVIWVSSRCQSLVPTDMM